MSTTTAAHSSSQLGWWTANGTALAQDAGAVTQAIEDIFQPLYIVKTGQGLAVGRGGLGAIGPASHDKSALPIVGVVPAIRPETLGDPSFCVDHGLKYPYVSGGMAAGIGSADIVEALARCGMLGFFGAAGLVLP